MTLLNSLNSPVRWSVEGHVRESSQSIWRPGGRCLAILAIAASLCASACVQIDGGAVELSWGLRDVNGNEIRSAQSGESDCQLARIGEVRVCWASLDATGTAQTDCAVERTDAGIVERFRAFDCDDKRGVSRFEVPVGATAFFVQPICGDGRAPPGPYQVPPPIVRTVKSGAVTTLNQLLIVVSEESCRGTDCTCTR